MATYIVNNIMNKEKLKCNEELVHKSVTTQQHYLCLHGLVCPSLLHSKACTISPQSEYIPLVHNITRWIRTQYK